MDKRPRGRPPFQPSDEQRKTVTAMAGYGIPQEGICKVIGIDLKTLRKHFREELDKGEIVATTKVAESLFKMATEDKNVSAAIFWMKARANWSEKVRHETEMGPNTIEAVLKAIDGRSRDIVTPTLSTALPDEEETRH